MSPTNYARYKYTPDEMGKEEFLARFSVRGEIATQILHELKTSDYSVANQHFILIGQRGQGKTTLLRKIQLDVQADTTLSTFLLPIKFAEEQYQIRSLCRLWEEVADYLQAYYYDEFGAVLDGMERHFEDDNYELQCYSYLEKAVNDKGKKLLLLIDNIDEMLDKLTEKETRLLREILITSSMLRIIGGSTKMLEQHHDYGKPFYEFFKIINLSGLNHEESKTFLLSLGSDEQKKRIQEVLQKSPERLETLRQLTGGVPRTLVMLFDIFLDSDGDAFDDLLRILDEATPLYKHRMDDLPTQLQAIVDAVAMHWDGMYASEIAKKTKLESKVVSAQLKQLEKYQIIESRSVGKNKIYLIRERFFNIWYLMRFGRKKDRQRVEWLVRFLTAWYDKDELEQKANDLINATVNGKIRPHYAHFMGEALKYSGIDDALSEVLHRNIKNYLDINNPTLSSEMSDSILEVIKKSQSYFEQGEITKAIKILEELPKNSSVISFHLGVLYSYIKEYKKALPNLLSAYKMGEMNAVGLLGAAYAETGKYSKALKYFLESVKLGNVKNRIDACRMYFLIAKEPKKALKFLQETKTLLPKNARILSLSAKILLWNEHYDESYADFVDAIPQNHQIDIYIYLTLLIAKGQYHQAKKFFEMDGLDFKEKYKVVWYALMHLMQEEHPYEIAKMGNELKESVAKILGSFEWIAQTYALEA